MFIIIIDLLNYRKLIILCTYVFDRPLPAKKKFMNICENTPKYAIDDGIEIQDVNKSIRGKRIFMGIGARKIIDRILMEY